MKITHRGMEITDIPYFNKILIDDDGSVWLDYCDCESGISREELIALRDAFTEVLRLQEEITVISAPPRPAPRVFRDGNSEPGPEVTAVIDRDNDRWVRRDDGGWLYPDSARPWTWDAMVEEYGPVTEDRHV